jgi:type III pantothenate kinase
MLLTIDVGNTNVVYGVFRGKDLLHTFRAESTRGKTSDEFAVTLRSLLQMVGIEPTQIHHAIVASVVPALTEPMVALAKRAFGCTALVVGPGLKTGMPILYENPKEVGADRIVNAVAAYDKVKSAVIVVDFGTATTFDCVTPKGEYLGGVIAPGLQISAEALFARAAKLPRVEIAKPAKVVGRNTLQSMQSGIVYGYVGLVDGLAERIQAELGYAPCPIIATGGLANLIAPLSSKIESVDDMLTLTGLRMIFEMNQS